MLTKRNFASLFMKLCMLFALSACSSGGDGLQVDALNVPADFAKTPYLIYPGDDTQMTLLWQLDAKDASVVKWGLYTSCSSGQAVTTEYNSSHQHAYTFNGLVPGIRYYYKVFASKGLSKGSFLAAPQNTATRVKFFVFGDTRTYPATHNALASQMISAYSTDPEFQTMALMVGDLTTDGNYETFWTSDYFNQQYTNIQQYHSEIPVQIAMGNHEGTGELFQKYFPYPFVANRYWSFDYGPAHVAVLDQYEPQGFSQQQLDWVTNDLAMSTKTWKIIIFHEPGWSAGPHAPNVDIQQKIQPLAKRYGAILIGGHLHYYARAVVDGVQHITTGGGGAELMAPNPSSQYVVKTDSSHHYCTIEIDGNSLLFRAIRLNGGGLIESFTLTK